MWNKGTDSGSEESFYLYPKTNPKPDKSQKIKNEKGKDKDRSKNSRQNPGLQQAVVT